MVWCTGWSVAASVVDRRQALAVLTDQIALAFIIILAAALVHIDAFTGLADESIVTEHLSTGVIADTLSVNATLTFLTGDVTAGVATVDANVHFTTLANATVHVAFTALIACFCTEALVAPLTDLAIKVRAAGA